MRFRFLLIAIFFLALDVQAANTELAPRKPYRMFLPVMVQPVGVCGHDETLDREWCTWPG